MLALMFFTFSACSSGTSQPDLTKEIQANSNYKNVKVIKTIQQYQDSYRSPNDSGTTYVVEAQVESVDGSQSTKTLKVFIAESDGWVNVQ